MILTCTRCGATHDTDHPFNITSAVYCRYGCSWLERPEPPTVDESFLDPPKDREPHPCSGADKQ